MKEDPRTFVNNQTRRCDSGYSANGHVETVLCILYVHSSWYHGVTCARAQYGASTITVTDLVLVSVCFDRNWT